MKPFWRVFRPLRMTLGTQLGAFIVMMLLLAVGIATWLTMEPFIRETRSLAIENSLDLSAGIAGQARGRLQVLAERTKQIGMFLLDENLSSAKALAQAVLENEPDILITHLVEMDENGGFRVRARELSPGWLSPSDPQGQVARALVMSHSEVFRIALHGEAQVRLLKHPGTEPLLRLTLPLTQAHENRGYLVDALVRQSALRSLLPEREGVSALLVDQMGILLASSGILDLETGADVSARSGVRQLLEGKVDRGLVRSNQGAVRGVERVAFQPVRFGGLGVVTEASDERLFEALNRVRYRALLLLLAFTSLALMVGLVFSDSWTGPIRDLVDGVKRIGAGDFAIRLKKPGAKELGDLSVAFNTMARGLEERERIKGTFRKFHHSRIAEHLLSGEMKLGGDLKEAAILFCDLRGFTALTHDREPTWVVRLLNEFLGPMVRIIEKNNGVVDKYIGDSIMAVWGIPFKGSDDARDAVTAALEMIRELGNLNVSWLKTEGIQVQMGIGIHFGAVIAGNIGSEGKMEYTVVGESVNIASRVEGMTKVLHADILVTRAVAERLGEGFELVGCPLVRAKGLEAPLEVFEVRGRKPAAAHETRRGAA